MYRVRYRTAFSLVELSIVLVILGLLVGGVLSGQSLIRASELRAVTTEFSNYTAALGSFRGKYFALPGDMNNAVRFWGARAGGTADGADNICLQSITTSGITTCNGNGDGSIAYAYYISSTQFYTESYLSWQHLVNAGLIEGTYSGIPKNMGALPGTNVPRSRLNNAAWFMQTITGKGVSLDFGAVEDSVDDAGDPILKPEEAWNIDTKLDDGVPTTGKITAIDAAGNCLNGTGDAYLLSDSGIHCALTFITGF